jgi:antibiotic biosynthesis monooxygenase (ABM) superfamily enzyme
LNSGFIPYALPTWQITLFFVFLPPCLIYNSFVPANDRIGDKGMRALETSLESNYIITNFYLPYTSKIFQHFIARNKVIKVLPPEAGISP